MPSERIDGIKYNLGKEPDGVVAGIRDNLLEKHVRLVGDIERVTGELLPLTMTNMLKNIAKKRPN
jgi:hypothetical protein